MVLWTLSEFQAVSFAQNNTADTPAIPMEKQLGDIIKRLDSEDWAEREKASDDLRELRQNNSTPVMKMLREYLPHLPAEAKARVTAEMNLAVEAAKIRESLAVFNLIMPEFDINNFVIYNTGYFENSAFRYEYVWIIKENENTLTFLTTDMETSNFPKLVISSLVNSPDYIHPADKPLPGQYIKTSFPEFAKEILSNAVQNDLQGYSFIFGNCIQMSMFAYWSMLANEENTAIKFFELANKSRIAANNSESFEDLLNAYGAICLKIQALRDASNGVLRETLVKKWNVINKLTGSQESAEMVSLYNQLIAEDAEWIEPEFLMALNPEKQAEYWLFKLRDCGKSQYLPNSFLDTSYIAETKELPEELPAGDPVYELLKLGWHAVPLLIDHFEDERPTRQIAKLLYRRLPVPSDFLQSENNEFLLSYADCCHIIFEKIRGNVGPFQFMKNGFAQSCKSSAAEWWKKNKTTAPAAYYLGLLLDKSSNCNIGMLIDGILRTDKDKYLPELMKIVLRNDELNFRKDIFLQAMAPYLTKEHVDFLKQALQKEFVPVVIEASRILWLKFGYDDGVKIITAKMLEEAGGGQQLWTYYFNTKPAFELLGMTNKVYVLDALAVLSRNKDTAIRDFATRALSEFPAKKSTD